MEQPSRAQRVGSSGFLRPRRECSSINGRAPVAAAQCPVRFVIPTARSHGMCCTVLGEPMRRRGG